MASNSYNHSIYSGPDDGSNTPKSFNYHLGNGLSTTRYQLLSRVFTTSDARRTFKDHTESASQELCLLINGTIAHYQLLIKSQINAKDNEARAQYYEFKFHDLVRRTGLQVADEPFHSEHEQAGNRYFNAIPGSYGPVNANGDGNPAYRDFNTKVGGYGPTACVTNFSGLSTSFGELTLSNHEASVDVPVGWPSQSGLYTHQISPPVDSQTLTTGFEHALPSQQNDSGPAELLGQTDTHNQQTLTPDDFGPSNEPAIRASTSSASCESTFFIPSNASTRGKLTLNADVPEFVPSASFFPSSSPINHPGIRHSRSDPGYIFEKNRANQERRRNVKARNRKFDLVALGIMKVEDLNQTEMDNWYKFTAEKDWVPHIRRKQERGKWEKNRQNSRTRIVG